MGRGPAQPGSETRTKGRFTLTKFSPNPSPISNSNSGPQLVPTNNTTTSPFPLSSPFNISSPSPFPLSSPSPMASSFFTPQQSQTQQFQTQQNQTQQNQIQQFQLQQNQIQQGQLLLYVKENKAPAGWGTKWEDLHADSQKVLLQIEERIREYRDESEKLDQCSRLYESSVSNEGFELDATHIIQELGSTSTSIDREKLSLQKLSQNLQQMMRNTELAVHSYSLLKPRFSPTNQIAPAVPFDFYNGLPKRPSAFFVDTVERLRKFLEECVKWIEELEQLVQMEGNKDRTGSIESLPKVMANLHDYFIYVASKVENLHQYVEQMKTAYLTDQRRRGDYNSDPFLEADRRDAARRAAAAMRVHPTLHLPPATPTAAPQTPTPNPNPQQTPQQTPPLIGSGLFNTPAPSSAGLFGGAGSTPFGSGSGSLFGSTPAPASGFGVGSTPAPASGFGSGGLFGSTLAPASGFGSGGLFGSTPAPASGFGSGATGFGIGSTPAQTAVGGSNLFSTPAFGGATASGASFGGTSKAARPKTRTGRR